MSDVRDAVGAELGSPPAAPSRLATLRDAITWRRAFMAALRQYPPNRSVPRVRGIAPFLYRAPEHVPGLARLERAVRGPLFERDLLRLHDVLESSPLAGRTWVWGGALLGWAREGRLLAHDQKDFDLAYLAEDDDRFEATRPLLAAAGFAPWFQYRNNQGVVTESTFVRRGAHFELWRVEQIGPVFEYYMYGAVGAMPVQMRCQLPAQPRAPFSLLGRTWHKVVDHEAELTALYGNWRIPDPSWDYVEQGGVLEREPWRGGPC